MTLEVMVGAVGIIVTAITFIGGMLAFGGLDQRDIEDGSTRPGDPAVPSSTRDH